MAANLIDKFPTALTARDMTNYYLYVGKSDKVTDGRIAFYDMFANLGTGTNGLRLGSGAGAANTTGNRSTYLGVNAGNAATSGNDNVAVGYQALALDTTGRENTAFGTEALYSNLTTHRNTAFGYRALYTAAASPNLGFGHSAGFSITTGFGNILIGSSAGYNITTGRSNIVIEGNESIVLISTGNRNTLLGSDMGTTLATGSDNTLIGNACNVSAAGANFQTAIGAGAICTADNQVMLGRSSETVVHPGPSTFSGLVTATAGMTLSGGAVSINNSSNFNTTINTGTSTGAVTIGNATAGLISIGPVNNNSQAFKIWDSVSSTWYNLDTRTGVTGVIVHKFDEAGTISFASAAGSTCRLMGLGSLVVTLTGTTTVTAMSGMQLLIASPTVTNTSAGLTITTASTMSVAGPLPAGNATFTNSVTLDIPTYATNGTTASGIRIAAPTGAGTNWALNVTSGGITVADASTIAGLLTASAGATISGAATGINDSSNFATTINTGTSTGAVTIGNSAVGVITIAAKAATTDAMLFTNGSGSNFYRLDTRGGTSGVLTHRLLGASASFASAAGNTYTAVNIPAFTLTQTGTTTITALNGLSFLINSPTITDSSAVTVTTASAVQINGPVGAGSVTITNAYTLDLPTFVSPGGAGTIAAGLTIAQPTGAANNYLIYFPAAGKIGCANTFDIDSSNTNTTAMRFRNITGNVFYTMATTTATANSITHKFAIGAANSYAAAAGSTYSLMDLGAYTHTFTGSTGVTALSGLSLKVNSPTITDASALTVTTATGVEINGPLPAGSVTFTTSVALDLPTFVTNGTTGIGLRIAAPSGAATNLALQCTSGNVSFAGTFSTYNNVATAGWGVGAIVAQGRATAQTAQSAALATYTVGAADGSFWVSGNVNVTASATHSFSLDVTYTDETNTARTLILPVAQLAGAFVAGGLITNVTGTGPYEAAKMQIRCKAATSITIRPSAGTFTSVTYNAEGIIEQAA